MKYINNWKLTKKNFCNWWKREKEGKPLMRIVAMRDTQPTDIEREKVFNKPGR